MVEQITAGIRVSVATHYEGTFLKGKLAQYAFGYHIVIENQGQSSVQLLKRHWEIRDALSPVEFVYGDGVIGKQPIIDPKEVHTYSSGCVLKSPIGAMKGHYDMMNRQTGKKFRVQIPIFQLNGPFTLN